MGVKNKMEENFGIKSIENATDLQNAVKEAESIISGANSKRELSEFDKKLIVEGASSSDLPRTRYQKLQTKSVSALKVVLQNLTMQDIDNYEEIQNAEGISSNGEEFKCFATLDETGNLIVTKNKVIKINKKDSENYTYEESRKEGKGIKTVKITSVHGIANMSSRITSGKLTEKEIKDVEMFSKFFGSPNNIRKLDMQGMSNEEKVAYKLELQRLGVEDGKFTELEKMTKEQAEQAKENGTVRHVTGIDMASRRNGKLNKQTVNYMYDDATDKPRMIWNVEQDGNSQNFTRNVYRLEANGKYVNTSDVKFVNGKPKFEMLTLEEIEAKLEEGYPIEYIKAQMRKNRELNAEMPKEAEMIQDNAERQIEKAKNPEREEEVYPGENE